MRFAVALVLSVALAGCSSVGADVVTPQHETSPVDCLTVNAESIEAVRVGVKAIQASNDVGRAAALKGRRRRVVRRGRGHWPGCESPGRCLVDSERPTVTPSNAYNAVDRTAHQFSDYVASPFYDVTSAGVDDVRSCLG